MKAYAKIAYLIILAVLFLGVIIIGLILLMDKEGGVSFNFLSKNFNKLKNAFDFVFEK